jgi:hypothetical protein
VGLNSAKRARSGGLATHAVRRDRRAVPGYRGDRARPGHPGPPLRAEVPAGVPRRLPARRSRARPGDPLPGGVPARRRPGWGARRLLHGAAARCGLRPARRSRRGARATLPETVRGAADPVRHPGRRRHRGARRLPAHRRRTHGVGPGPAAADDRGRRCAGRTRTDHTVPTRRAAGPPRVPNRRARLPPTGRARRTGRPEGGVARGDPAAGHAGPRRPAAARGAVPDLRRVRLRAGQGRPGVPGREVGAGVRRRGALRPGRRAPRPTARRDPGRPRLADHPTVRRRPVRRTDQPGQPGQPGARVSAPAPR